MTKLPVLARRFISQTRWDEANLTPEIREQRRIYDPVRDGWTEFVIVPDDDPKAETAEIYE